MRTIYTATLRLTARERQAIKRTLNPEVKYFFSPLRKTDAALARGVLRALLKATEKLS